MSARETIDRATEIETLIDAYEQSGRPPETFALEFWYASRLVVKAGIPAREQILSVNVPFRKVGRSTEQP